MSITVRAPERRDIGGRGIGRWPITAWMGAAFLIALALALIVLAIFGAGGQGIEQALRITGRWSFLLFWLAYVGGAMAKLWKLQLGGLVHCGRELGLAFASAQLVHVGLVLWLLHITTGPVGSMLFFWIGVLCTYLLSLFSLPRFRDALGLRFWWAFRLFALEYIALVFADDFILIPLQATGFRSYPVSYVPFAILLVGGAGIRLTTFIRHGIAPRMQGNGENLN